MPFKPQTISRRRTRITTHNYLLNASRTSESITPNKILKRQIGTLIPQVLRSNAMTRPGRQNKINKVQKNKQPSPRVRALHMYYQASFYLLY